VPAAGLALVATLVAVGIAGAGPPSPCVGAAARDAQHRCTANLSRTVSPKPGDVALAPTTAGCRPTGGPPDVCAFGAPAGRARDSIALVGDSHALHWRAALEVVAHAKRWRGYSLTTAGCPFSAVVEHLPAGLREPCVEWYADARAWFAAHPEVSTVFVSQTNKIAASAPGRTEAQLKRAGYARAWSALPRTVERVVILRDVPDPADDTFECVDRALATGIPRLGLACPTPRAKALAADPAYTTARALKSRRYRAIDLSSLFCTPKRCYPVIGGVQVYADIFGHVTAAYMKTVGPYLLGRLGG
jgi:hypothetical protein